MKNLSVIKKVFVVNFIQITDGSIDNSTEVFEDRLSAKNYMKEIVGKEKEHIKEIGWTIGCDSDCYFVAVNNKSKSNNYIEVDLSAYTVKPHQVFNYDYEKEIAALKLNLVCDIRRLINTFGKDNGNCIVDDNEDTLIWSALTHVTKEGLFCVVDQVKCDKNIDRGVTVISDGVVVEIDDYDNLYTIYNAVLDWFIDVASETGNKDMLKTLCRMDIE